MNGLLSSPFVRKYLVPGAVFQSVLVGGGYGTGREIVEFFTRFGALGGVLGLGVTVACWALVLAVTWEFARVHQVYDYRRFFKALLGRFWPTFEVLFVAMFLMVLAVVASAAGEILREQFGISYALGIAVMLAVVAGLTFYGRDVVTRFLASWTVFLYLMFAVYFTAVIARDGSAISQGLAEGEALAGWGLSGLKYAMYNVSIAPAILFSTRALETRRETAISALVAALMCAAPALVFHLSFVSDLPAVLSREIPVFHIISGLGLGLLTAMYLVTLFGTFVETGAGLIQGTVERIDGGLAELGRPALSRTQRGVLAMLSLLVSAGLASLGIVALIARGYGSISWGFMLVYVVPVLTLGVARIARAERAGAAGPAGPAGPAGKTGGPGATALLVGALFVSGCGADAGVDAASGDSPSASAEQASEAQASEAQARAAQASTAEAGTLQERVARELDALPAQTAVYARALETDDEIAVRADVPMNTLSTIKIPIMILAYRDADAGRLDLDERYTVRPEDLQRGSGLLQHFDDGLAPTFRDLITQMIITSDNTATDIMLERVGLERVNGMLDEFGFVETRVQASTGTLFRRVWELLDPAFETLTDREVYERGFPSDAGAAQRTFDFEGDPQEWLGATTAREMSRMLAMLHAGEWASEAATEEMMSILSRQFSASRLPLYLRAGERAAHKTGDWPPFAGNDVGILFGAGQPIVVSVFGTQNRGGFLELEAAEGRIARMLLDAWSVPQ